MKPLPIRWRFAVWTSGMTTFILLIYSGFTLLNFFQEQIEAVDLEIAAEGNRLLGMKDLAEMEEEAKEVELYAPWLGHAVLDDIGSVNFRSARLTDRLVRAAHETGVPRTFQEGGDRWRIAVFSRSGRSVLIAYNLDEVWSTLEDLVMAYAFSLAIVVGITAACGWWISGRLLRPLGELTAAVERVETEKLGERVPVPAARDELQRLTIVFNAMLARLQESFEQAQRFAADASHELRTPLTIMRGEVDGLMRAQDITPEHQKRLVSVQEEIARLHHITDNLLSLARFDTGSVQIPMQELDLSALVAEACDDAELLGESRHVRIERDLNGPQRVAGDKSHIRRVVLNLLDNAIKFNVPGGVVRCSLAAERTGAVLRVGNSGPGIPSEMRPRLFQRFFRADLSRGDTDRGHGLGLSLSREIARAHGGDLRLSDSTTADWTEFEFTMPPASGIPGSMRS